MTDENPIDEPLHLPVRVIHPIASSTERFQDPDITADGKQRARVSLAALRTLWFNTGTLCNLTCANCYIHSSPTNDSLVYLTADEVVEYLDQIANLALPTRQIGFTGGEPFMNPQIIATIEQCLARGFSTLVLTNAMRPMMKLAAPLLELRQRFGERLVLRVSLDHYRSELHEQERGKHTWLPTMRGMHWLANNGFQVHVAGRLRWGDAEPEMRLGYAALFGREQIGIDAQDPGQLVLFPEMDESAVVPEITTDCWAILHKEPGEVMCASARMVLKRKGQARASVVACTLLPHSAGFDTGPELADALGPVKLNHPHCAKFCVLGGGRCSG